MSYISDPNSYGLDISVKRDWYSVSSNNDTDFLEDYCAFCLTNFKQYHPIVNNVCQSCGRVAEPIMRDDQQFMKATSNNASNIDDSAFQGVSMDIDYSPTEKSDPTKDTIHTSGQRMTAVGAGQAIRKINEADRIQSKIVSAMLRNERFLIKVDLNKNKPIEFDNNLEDNLI